MFTIEGGNNQPDDTKKIKKITTTKDVQNVSDNIERSKILPKISDFLEGSKGNEEIDKDQLEFIEKRLEKQNLINLKDIFQKLKSGKNIYILLEEKEVENQRSNDNSNSSEGLYKGQESIDNLNNSADIQAEIDRIKEKGGDMTRKEKRILYKLNKKLIKLEKAETTQDVERNKGNKEVIKDLAIIKNALSSLDLSKYGVEGKNNLMTYLEAGDYDKVIDILKDQQTFISIADDLGGKGDTKYESFKNSLLKINRPLFEEKFKDYELGLPQKSSYMSSHIKGLDVGDATVVEKTGDGFVVETTSDGRTLSAQGSDYKMEANVDNEEEKKEFKQAEQNAKEEIAPINESINSILKISRYVDKAIRDGLELEEVKQEIQKIDSNLFDELDIESADSLEDLKLKLSGAYIEKKREKEDLLEVQKEILKEIAYRASEKAREKDENKKETLKFLHSIGFDILDQDLTNSLIRMINSNNAMRTLLGFTEEIDLANGKLGIQKDGNFNKIGYKEKIIFAEFTNIIISGNKTEPLSIESIGIGDNGFSDRGKFKTKLISYGITTSNGKTIGMKNIGDYLNNKLKNLEN